MTVTAKLKHLHIATRKVREVADLIRGKKAGEAQTILEFLVKKPAEPMLKLLKSAITSANHNFKLDQENLYISKIIVDEGPKLKRWRPGSRGRTSPIMRRTSHITLVLGEINKTEENKVKDKKNVAFVATENPLNKEAKKDKKIVEKQKFKQERRGRNPEKEIGMKRIFQRKSI